MPLTNAYTDLATVKSYLGVAVSTYDTQLTMAVNAASRSIDNYCHRRFWLDPTPVARTFAVTGPLELELDNDGIGDTAGLVVKTDPAGDGTYGTTWAAGDYQLLPVNAAYASPEPQPWTAIQAVGIRIFPTYVTGYLRRVDRVQITARWGWPAVPDAVVQACLIKASSLFHRKDSPQGIAGFGDFGPVRLTSREDADVVKLLDPYRFLVLA